MNMTHSPLGFQKIWKDKWSFFFPNKGAPSRKEGSKATDARCSPFLSHWQKSPFVKSLFRRSPSLCVTVPMWGGHSPVSTGVTWWLGLLRSSAGRKKVRFALYCCCCCCCWDETCKWRVVFQNRFYTSLVMRKEELPKPAQDQHAVSLWKAMECAVTFQFKYIII